ncbi:penicillin-binding protein 1A [Moritella viscosa]|uniref:Penicillin-binding protein 1A n=1 Tax=Moritella viscosa TaxID=80854 RepID=A0A1K9Z6J6_9GAMM|nr:PBP1A family penicillin-binding protein [Moritella viscosa]SGY91878.1 Putative penicillin-binding protein 1A [Moritella viscosa]SGY96239.1 Putative penicillin-binding protein 1A [Moritella viscosa]SGZ01802.1 Putative penicillin-binding protein 1A [Moritella viscosa]SGZ02231.1 Putative penicillin-binding protein 1A [Moritella viscosa]SHO06868.1 Putative penicillin-binding protein 1A [Moritella viscosa]
MEIIVKWIKRLSVLLLVSGLFGVGSIIALYFYIKPELPDVTTLKTIQLQTPMKVFSQDGKLISQFGEKRRIPIEIDDVPPLMIKAFLATEDNRFYTHPGIDPIGIIRAASIMIMTGERKQGASTITQQVARNFFLTREKTFIRKIKEIFLAWHIEQNLTKNEILTLYLNKIPLGYRSFGIGSAAQVYYGKTLNELTLAQMAVIAGLPKAPSALNPIRSPKRAKARRHVVLLRMLDENYITQAQFEDANTAPITGVYHGAEIDLSAPYLAEMVRSEMISRYGEEKAYTQGLNVYTTVHSNRQTAATTALINNLLNYDLRHGYRGPLGQAWTNDKVLSNEDILLLLKDKPSYKPLQPAVIMTVKEQQVEALLANGDQVTVSWAGLKWARPFISDKKQGPAPQTADAIVNVGDIVLLRPMSVDNKHDQWMLGQLPDASSAFIAIDNNDGAIEALVGGFNYQQSKFNRVTQAERQIGSNIKPFVYSAGLAQGATLASLINDAPINQWDPRAGTAWRPKNSPPTYNGPTRLRLGLAQSKNVMSVRLFRQVGLTNAINYMARFGFDKSKLPRNESLALGSASLTPLKVAVAFATFANGGFKVEPYFIDRIENANGELLYQTTPKQACLTCEKQIALNTDDPEYWSAIEGDARTLCDIAPYGTLQVAPRIITEQNAFLMRQMMASVIWGGGSWRHKTGWNGTGWRAAAALKRHDLGGKTGTTNEAKDAWFSGFNPDISATSWIGFDDHRRELGRVSRNINLDKHQVSGGEAGAKTAQPAWIEFMKSALEGIPERPNVLPENIVQVRIDRESGLLTYKSDYTSRFEYFIQGTEPTEYVNNQDADSSFNRGGENSDDANESLDDLF